MPNDWADQCVRAYAGALCSKYTLNTESSFQQVFLDYLRSTTFRDDVRNHKWGGSIMLPIVGAPVALSAENTDDEWSHFQQQITNLTTESINYQFLQAISQSVPDPAMAKAFNDCLSGNSNRIGFLCTPQVEEDNKVVLHISYNKPFINDPNPCLLQDAVVVNGNGGFDDADDSPKSKGDEITDQFFLVELKRDPTQNLYYFLQTDHGLVQYVKPVPPPRPKLATLIVTFKLDIWCNGGRPNDDLSNNIVDSNITAQYWRGDESPTESPKDIMRCGYQALIDSHSGPGYNPSWKGGTTLTTIVDSDPDTFNIKVNFNLGNSRGQRDATQARTLTPYSR